MTYQIILRQRRTIQKALLCLFCGVVFSCQEVIDVDLNDADAELVIEGSISNEGNGCTVILSETVSFDASNTFPAVSGATISISDGTNTYTLEETTEGTYQNTKIWGKPGTTYELTVSVNDETYTATSTMPRPVLIDSILINTETGSIFYDDDEMFIEVKFRDTPNEENYYRLNVWINDEDKALTDILDDDLEDGQMLAETIISQGDEDDPEFDSGDTATILLYTIDENVYEYYRTLNEGSSSLSTAPSNPTTNFDKDVLGFFSAHSVTSRTIIIP